MADYNELFIEENNKLRHLGSCTGSNTPSIFSDIKTIADWEEGMRTVLRENGFYPHSTVSHPFPWSSYKISDNLLVLRKKRFLFFWNRYSVWIATEKNEGCSDDEAYFISMNKWFGDECEEEGRVYNKKDLELLQLPPITKKKS